MKIPEGLCAWTMKRLGQLAWQLVVLLGKLIVTVLDELTMRLVIA